MTQKVRKLQQSNLSILFIVKCMHRYGLTEIAGVDNDGVIDSKFKL